MNSKPERILVIKMADIGDVLTATPALRALRQTFPEASLSLLLTHHTAAVMQQTQLVDDLIPTDNFRFFHPKEALKPHLLKEAIALLRHIRRQGFDTVVILHHLTMRTGALKYATIAKLSGAKTIVGLKPPGRRGQFLTASVPDEGFGARHEIDYWLAVVGLLGATTTQTQMELAVSEADIAWARLQLTVNARKAQSPVVVLHPGSGGFSVARRWAASHFATVADALIEQGATLVLVGTNTDGTEAVLQHMQHHPINLTGQTTLHQLAALLQRADLYIGGDSGVTHVASASNIPLIAIFGPTNVAAWGPRGDNRVVLQANLPCSPCAYAGHQVGLRTGCPPRTCLKLITPTHVLSAAGKLLGAKLDGGAPPATRSDSLPKKPDVAADLGFSTPLNPLGKGGAGSPFQQPHPVDFPTTTILDVHIHRLTFQQTLDTIEAFIANGCPHQITTVNPEFVVAAQSDLVFRQIINRSALALADGVGLLKAAQWLGQPPFPERVAGSDLVEAIVALATKRGYRLYFLGAQPGVAEKAIAVLAERYPGFKAAGAYAGSPGPEEEDSLVARIQAAHPDIVLVAYGAPQQDKWIARNMPRLPASVLIGVGGSFDFIAGSVPRAPRWMQQMGIEWLHRLIQQPSRWKRIWNAVPRFTWLVWRERFSRGG